MTSVTDLQTMFVDLLWCQDLFLRQLFFLELDRIMKSAEIFAIIIFKVKKGTFAMLTFLMHCSSKKKIRLDVHYQEGLSMSTLLIERCLVTKLFRF